MPLNTHDRSRQHDLVRPAHAEVVANTPFLQEPMLNGVACMRAVSCQAVAHANVAVCTHRQHLQHTGTAGVVVSTAGVWSKSMPQHGLAVAAADAAEEVASLLSCLERHELLRVVDASYY